MYKPEDYMVNKGQKVKYEGRSYVYGDDLPEGLKIPKDWIDQRVLIIKKAKKEAIIKKKIKKTTEVN